MKLAPLDEAPPLTAKNTNNSNQDNCDTTSDLFLSNDLQYNTNDLWGDNLGDKPNNITRVYFQNIHGIIHHKSWNKWKEIADMLSRYKVDVAGLVETNINWNPTNCAIAKSILRTRNQHVVMTTAHSDDPTLSTYQPGGMSLVLQNNLTGAIDSTNSDARGLGRWTYCILNGRKNHKLVIITAYRLSHDSIPGDDTIYAQQYRLLRKQHIDHPKPKKIFDVDLCKLLDQWFHKQYDILLMMDANTNTNDVSLQRIINSAKLYDILGATHGYNSPPTYIRGTKTIDYMFGTERVLQAVKNGGIRPFNAEILSDHRALWIDLDMSRILGQNSHPLHIREKIPTTKNKKWALNARMQTTKLLRMHNVQADIEHLFHEIQTENPRQNLIQKLEKIDNNIQHAMTSSVKLYTNHRAWWSTTLHHALLVRKYWLLRRTEIVTGMSMNDQMQAIINILPRNTINTNPSQRKTITKHLQTATKDLRHIMQNDKQHRQNFLLSKSLQYRLENDNQKAKNVFNMQRAEMMPAVYKKIRTYLNPTKNQQLNFIDTQSPTGKIRITKRDQLEETLLKHHSKHFTQAKSTPLATPEVIERFGLATDTKHATNFRTGDTSELHHWKNPIITQFLQHLMPHDDDPPPIDTKITVEHVKRGFRIWREATCTSPSGRKLPLYKIWLLPDVDNDDIMSGNEFFKIITDMITMSQLLQHPLQRWTTAYNMFVYKQPGNFSIEKLRPIHQLEAELNLVRRELISRRLMKNAESYQRIPMNNSGGRKGRTAIDVVMLKYLTISTFHMTRKNCAITDCDARACYDRILPHILFLCYSKMGLPTKDCVWLARALVTMRYHILTGHGPSSAFSTTDNEQQLFGIGQGATDASAGWLLISTILSRVYDTFAKGCKLKSPDALNNIQWSHIMFVDDTNLIHSTPDHNDTVDELHKIVHDEVNTWNEGLRTSGGYLNGNKTHYYILHWLFHKDGTPYLDPEIDPSKSVFISNNNTTEHIKQIPPDHDPSEYKSLGVRTPATLRDTYELNNILKKGRVFSKFLTACPTNKLEAWTAYTMFFVPSYTYSAVTLSLNDSDIKKIHRTFIPTLLPKLGYQSTFPRSVVFAPQHIGGIGLVPFNVIITHRKIQFLIRHIRKNTELGTTILINLKWAMLQAGRQNAIFTSDDRIDYIENQWAIQLHNELKRMTGKLLINDITSASISRVNDQFLMDCWDRQGLSIKSMYKLNLCRIYLRVTKLSDIVSNDGKHIQFQYLTGEKINPYTDMEWPHQPKPSEASWKYWKQSLIRTFYSGNHLTNPLGSWITPPPKVHYFYVPSSNQIKLVQGNQIKTTRATETRRHIEYDNDWVLNNPSGKCIPLIENSQKQTKPALPKFYNTQQPTWEQKMKTSTTRNRQQLSSYTTVSKYLLLDLTNADTLWIVSDGGKDTALAYYGWVIADSRHILCEGKGLTTGNTEQMDSLRAESSGMVHALTVMVKLLTQVTCKAHIILASDNLQLVKRTKLICEYGSRLPNQYTAPHMDLQCVIDSMITEHFIDIEVIHVKGHQDTHKQTHLTWVEKLNVRADHLATKARFNHKPLSLIQQSSWHPEAAIQLYINKSPIHKWMNTAIHQSLTSNSFLNYLRTKLEWSHSTYTEVDWQQKIAVTAKTPKHLQPWQTKLGTNRLPLNGEKFYQSPTVTCPLCKTCVETSEHFLTCDHYPPIAQSLMNNLISIYNKYHIDPYLRLLLTRTIKGLPCDMQSICHDHQLFPVSDYKLLMQSQTKIGWINFLKGYPSKQWIYHQRRYNQEMYIEERPTDDMWLQHVYRILYTIYHDRWKTRNQIQHGIDQNYMKKSLLQRIQTLYSFKQSLHTQDQHCFKKPVHEWETSHVTEMKKWIFTYTPHIKHCLNLEKSRLQTQTRDIRQWLTPKTVPTPREHTIQHQPGKTDRTSNQTSIKSFLSTVSKGLRTKSRNKPTQTQVQHNKSTTSRRDVSLIQTILKLRPNLSKKNRTHKQQTPHSSQNTNDTQTPVIPDNSHVDTTHNTQHPERTGLATNNTGSIIAKITKKFERWKHMDSQHAGNYSKLKL